MRALYAGVAWASFVLTTDLPSFVRTVLSVRTKSLPSYEKIVASSFPFVSAGAPRLSATASNAPDNAKPTAKTIPLLTRAEIHGCTRIDCLPVEETRGYTYGGRLDAVE